ncbi:MAG: tetratricopeptide (TPR) repeat protein [Salibacteraceae bacterium]
MDKAEKIAPNDPEVEYNRGYAAHDLGLYEEAIKSTINPKKIECSMNMGNTYFNEEKFKKAISNFDKYNEMNPNSSTAYRTAELQMEG